MSLTCSPCCTPPAGVRLLRASKNRYGHGGALGVLSMDSGGLAAVANPSALFLADSTSGSRAASGITVVLEGNRPLVVEAQVPARLPACLPACLSACLPAFLPA
jgi:predicted ATP-dependent serine protease